MRITKFVPVLAVSALLMSCDRQPVAPDVDAPLFSATHAVFVDEFTDDFMDFVSCANDGAGEMLHWQGPIRITGTTTTSNSGNTLIKWDEFEYLEGFTITGLASGDVWTPVEGRYNQSFHDQHSGNRVRTTVYLETYENQDGDRMFIQTILHFTYANGAWRAFRIAISACSLR